MTNLPDLARKTAEKAIENMGVYIDWSEIDEGFFPTDNLANLILSCIQEAVKEVVVKQSMELSDILYTGYDFLWGELHHRQPCSCENCTHLRTGLRKLAKFIEDAGGSIPDKKKIPATESRPTKEDKGKRAERLRRMKL